MVQGGDFIKVLSLAALRDDLPLDDLQLLDMRLIYSCRTMEQEAYQSMARHFLVLGLILSY